MSSSLLGFTRSGRRGAAGQPRMAGRAACCASAAAAVLLVAVLGVPAAGAAPGRAGAPGGPAGRAAGLAGLAWGDNSAGELGNATLTPAVLPVAVRGLAGARAVSAGGRHELAVTSAGTVLAWGDDSFGQLGNGVASANGDSEVPAPVPGLAGVTAVAAGEEHSLALLRNGTVLAWGDNEQGQLGNGTVLGSAVPVRVKGLSGVKAIAAGSLFSLALLSDGTVMAWGRGDQGQLGDGRGVDSNVPVRVRGLTGVTAIAAGAQHALALRSDGTVMAWGDNELGQVGDGSTVSPRFVPVAVSKLAGVRAIAAGSFHSLALLSNGTVMAWGSNQFFQLARSDGFPGGLLDSDVPLTLPGVGKAMAIAAGGEFSLAIVAGGKVTGWGDNASGELGNGTVTTTPRPVTVRGVSGATGIAAGGVQSFAFLPAARAAAAAAAVPAGRVTGPVSSPWRVTVSPAAVCLGSVSAVSSTKAWAAEPCASQPLAARWNGKTWTMVTLPLPGNASTAELNGIDELSPANVWAVGNTSAGQATGQRTVIEHWNGKRWTVVPSPNPRTGSSAFDELAGVAGTSPRDLWAVGSYSDGTTFISVLLEHWNGTKWSFVREPHALHGSTFGTAVTVISPKDAWAVGTSTFGDTTAAAHWNGTVWTAVRTPALDSGPAPQNALTGITATGPRDVWASGFEGNVNGQNFAIPYLLHWNGKAWSLTRTPDPGSEGSRLEGVTALSPTDVWAAGLTDQADGASLTLTEHFNGKSWTVAPSLDPGELGDGPASSFLAIAGVAPHTLFAVGSMQQSPTPFSMTALAERTTTG